MAAPAIQMAPQIITVLGAPIRAAIHPASKLPNGAIPWNDIE
jgi:hypothetical protein